MSARGRGTKPKTNDFYPTPHAVTQAMLANINWDLVNSFHEPCYGDGAIYDIIPAGVIKSWSEIMLDRDYFEGCLPKVDLVLTNPPFTLAKEFITRSVSHAGTTIMLTRVNFLGSMGRVAFWKEIGLQQINIITPRPAFYAKCAKKPTPQCKAELFPLDYNEPCPHCRGNVSNSTDATEYAWLVFGNTDILIDQSPFRWLELK